MWWNSSQSHYLTAPRLRRHWGSSCSAVVYRGGEHPV